MPHRFFYPRPEYPRPERQRGTIEGLDWLNLNGPWQFRFDPNRVGVKERWFDPALPDWREQIIVPFCWESLAAWGEGDDDPHRFFRPCMDLGCQHTYQPNQNPPHVPIL